MSDYGVKDIKTLEGIEAIRLRPGVYSPSQKKNDEQRGLKYVFRNIAGTII